MSRCKITLCVLVFISSVYCSSSGFSQASLLIWFITPQDTQTKQDTWYRAGITQKSLQSNRLIYTVVPCTLYSSLSLSLIPTTSIKHLTTIDLYINSLAYIEITRQLGRKNSDISKSAIIDTNERNGSLKRMHGNNTKKTSLIWYRKQCT